MVYAFSMGSCHSTYDSLTNISPILTGVRLLDSSHQGLYNSLFIGYFISNIHGDIAACRVLDCMYNA